jgi:hypothetical protein
LRVSSAPILPYGERERKRMYTIERGWVDTADRRRTWQIIGPDGAKVAEITTKRDALKLVDLLNGKE